VEFIGPQNALKSLAVVASPQTHWGSVHGSPYPIARFTVPTSKVPTSNGRGGEEKGWEGTPK